MRQNCDYVVYLTAGGNLNEEKDIMAEKHMYTCVNLLIYLIKLHVCSLYD